MDKETIEDRVKNIMYADDVDWTLDIKTGSLTYPQTYQLHQKIKDALTPFKVNNKHGKETAKHISFIRRTPSRNV